MSDVRYVTCHDVYRHVLVCVTVTGYMQVPGKVVAAGRDGMIRLFQQ